MRGARLLLTLTALFGATSCTSVVRYTNELVDGRHGRSWFTSMPATFGGAVGFGVGVPVSVAVSPLSYVVYQTQPKPRDGLSTFFFPSYFLWRVCALVGAPFDAVEYGLYRAWAPEPPVTQAEREAIERQWDARGFNEYPVTPIYPEHVDG